MNLNITYNISNNIPAAYTGDLPSQCLIKGKQYSLECIHQTICAQFNEHFIKLGLIIIAVYIFLGWFLWYFMNYGYKYFSGYWNGQEGSYLNLNHIENRIYWDNWLRTRLTKFMLGYIVMVVYLSWNF